MLVRFTLNGRPLVAEADAQTSLLTYLRGPLGLTGTKNGCAEGHCGACTVLVDARPTRACLVRVGQLEGSRVETVEGLAESGELHPIQEAFLMAGAVQCGFCTPGFIMAAKGLLDRHRDPTEDQIKEGLRHNVCRCTGYVKIIEAVTLAGRMLTVSQGRTRHPPLLGTAVGHQGAEGAYGMGARVPDLDGPEKVTGRLLFADDLTAERMLHAAVVWSAHPHAEIVSIDTSRSLAQPGVRTVLTAADVPGVNGMGSLRPDQPVLCWDIVRFVGDAVALAVADTPAHACAAARAVRVAYRPLPGVFNPAEAVVDGSPALHAGGNLCEHLLHEVGDPGTALAEAALVVGGCFDTPFVEHGYLEPEAALARPDGDGGIMLHAPTQYPFELRRQLAAMLDLGEEKVRVVATPLGGAFGSKLENTVEALACLAAARIGEPVKLVLSRAESIRVSTKRHAFSMDYTAGFDVEGRLLAVDARLVADAGPYTTLSPRVIDQACLFSCGPYRVPHLRVEGWAVHTNNANSGAFRGFGINQVAVAIESLLDEAARRTGLDPLEIRLRNVLGPGDATVSGEILRAPAPVAETVTAVRTALAERLPSLAASHRPGWRIGVGVASAFKNVGAGKGKLDDAGAVFRLLPDGRVLLRASAVDMGQGTRTILVQIAGEALGLPPQRFALVTGDTAQTMRHGGASGERQTFITGRAVELAAHGFRGALLDAAALVTGRAAASLRLDGPLVRDDAGHAVLTLEGLAERMTSRGEEVETSYYHVAPRTYPLSDPDGRRGVPPDQYRNFPAYAYTTQAVIVEVEEATGHVRVLTVIAAHDCGRAVNPQKVEGQIEGSCLQGLGYALSEAYRVDHGVPLTTTYRQLGVPTIFTTPEIHVLLIEDPDPDGPFGAKGIAEVATVPVTPAILNAVYDATGVRVTRLPADRELIRSGMVTPAPHWWV